MKKVLEILIINNITLCVYVIVLHVTFISDLYKLTDEVLGQGAYAKVQGCISLQNGQEFAVKVSKSIMSVTLHRAMKNTSLDRDGERNTLKFKAYQTCLEESH